MSKTINQETVIGEILDVEGVEPILKKHSFPCVHCPMARMEMDTLKIGDVCQMYSINSKPLLDELNKFFSENGKDKPDKS